MRGPTVFHYHNLWLIITIMNTNLPQKAFSLAELLIVLTLLSIMLVITLPSWHELFAQTRAEVHAEKIAAALRLTRTSAILFGEPVKFCGSTDHKGCDGRWGNGQIVITQHSQQVLRVLPKIFPGDKLTWHNDAAHNNLESVVFLPTGFTTTGERGHFDYYPQNNREKAFRIVLMFTGKTHIEPIGNENRKKPRNKL